MLVQKFSLQVRLEGTKICAAKKEATVSTAMVV